MKTATSQLAKWTTHQNFLICLFSCLIPHQWVQAENLIARQLVTIDGPEAERSLWDEELWDNNTNPLAALRPPQSGDWLYFMQKGSMGSLGSNTQNFTLHTGTWEGFTPPAVTPVFDNMTISGDENLVFAGLPDTPGAPLGRLVVGAASGFDLTNGATSTLDHTLMTTLRTWIRGTSSLTVVGDLSGYDDAVNYDNTGVFWVQRNQGPTILPALDLAAHTRADLDTLRFGFNAPVGSPTYESAPVIRAGENVALNIATITLDQTAGILIDASAGGSIVEVGSIGWNTGSATVSGADEPLLFLAGRQNPALAPSTISITGQPSLRSFNGTLAEARDGGEIEFNDPVFLLGANQTLRLNASNGSQIRLPWLITDASVLDTDVTLDFLATFGSQIDMHTQTFEFLRLGEGENRFIATHGSEIILPRRANLPPGGNVRLAAEGTDAILRMPNWINFNARTLGEDWGTFVLDISEGASLQGGGLVDFGGGFFFADTWPLEVSDNDGTSAAEVFVSEGNVNRVDFQFNRPANIEIQQTSQLRHVGFTFPAGWADFSAVDWRTSSLETAETWQQLRTTGGPGENSTITIDQNSEIRDVNLLLGDGDFIVNPVGQSVTNLAVLGAATVTGSLRAAPSEYAVTHVVHAGTDAESGGLSGYRFIDLGLATSSFTFQELGNPGVEITEFFFSEGGTATLNVSHGAQIAVGSFASAHGRWVQPDSWHPATFAMNEGSSVSVAPSSSIFIGNVDSADDYDFRGHSIVVGPGGFFLGSGSVDGELVNAGGRIEPGFSPGEIVIAGQFLMENGELVIEVGADGHDRITADSIVITGGTIIIIPDPFSPPEASLVTQLLSAPNIEIDPSVTIIIDETLAEEGEFNPTTGVFTLAGEEDTNGVHPLLLAVLPATPTGVEMPELAFTPDDSPIFSFKRLTSSVAEYQLTVEISNDLTEWTLLPVPLQTTEGFEIESLDPATDLVSIAIDSEEFTDPTRLFFRLRVDELPQD